MVLNSETKVFGIQNTKEASLRSASKVQKFYGVGFPVGENINAGYFSKMSGIELIKRNITQLVRTNRGERFMLPLFGTNLKKYLFEPKDEFLFSKIRKEIKETLVRYAPFVEFIRLDIKGTDATTNQYRSGIELILYCKVKEEDDVVIDINLGII